uniref:uncharacterized protein LOC101301206 isoform X1 n=1 Tax=Fragaria vesca subsp. vesca TaxID=101020 RepID=UPI0005CB27FD|nr:PREDICTED: uncharacterized protein LOC101301206 isoform X1 [Fragaria vesca subsp. vesca]
MQWCFILQKRPIILVVVPFCSLLNGLQITLCIARSQSGSGSDSAPVSPNLSLPPSYKCDRRAACSTTPRNKNTISCEPADFHYKLIDWKRLSCSDKSEVSVDFAEVDSEEMTDDMEIKLMLEESLISSSCTECRICQVEDSVNEMEAPCRCNGTLTFAHRDCIQQWINLSYKATCEICKQPYEGGYRIPVPPPTPPPRQPTRREALDAIRARRAHVVVDAEVYQARLNAANSSILGRSLGCRIAPVLVFCLYIIVIIIISNIASDSQRGGPSPSPNPLVPQII